MSAAARTQHQRGWPEVRGAYRFDAPLAPTNWFGVGGPAELLFKPADTEDLAGFLAALPTDVPVLPIGVGSNLIIRDGGVRGAVIRLGRGFTGLSMHGDLVEAGAAVLDLHLARFAAEHGRGGLEFFAGIPGTVGGAVAMNAGAYGGETKDVLVEVEAVDRSGRILKIPVAECHYSYRHYGGPEGLIFTRAWFRTEPGAPDAVHGRIEEIRAQREATQPIRERTGGSTFKNPPGKKAWELIDHAGCRGLAREGAEISPLHCNFMINTGTATAAALEALGEEVRARVAADSGVTLEWEIKRVGNVSPDL
jgi:UDP-N-acetylmuramate dehydrogenase